MRRRLRHLAEGVNRAIRDLIARGRLNATSVMVVGAAIGRAEVAALQDAAASSPRCAIGLHVTLTAPFRPLTMHFRPLDGGMFLPFPKLLRSGLLRRLDPEMIDAEVAGADRGIHGAVRPRAGFRRRPSARATVSAGARRLSARGEGSAPDAWVRQCGRAQPLAGRLGDAQGAGARCPQRAIPQARRARRHRDQSGLCRRLRFFESARFRRADAEFLDGLPDGGLVMCHPGFVDETLESLDPLTTQREREYAYLASDAFPGIAGGE